MQSRKVVIFSFEKSIWKNSVEKVVKKLANFWKKNQSESRKNLGKKKSRKKALKALENVWKKSKNSKKSSKSNSCKNIRRIKFKKKFKVEK